MTLMLYILNHTNILNKLKILVFKFKYIFVITFYYIYYVIKYIRKKTELPTGEIIDYRYSGSVGNTKAGFEHWDLSGSVDTTGSFLSPFITTIGLYDDNCDLVAVAKLPQPIKSEPDIPVNFIIRFDT